MELFCTTAHHHRSGVIVVTHDLRALDIFDTIYDMEDGVLSRREGLAGSSAPLPEGGEVQ